MVSGFRPAIVGVAMLTLAAACSGGGDETDGVASLGDVPLTIIEQGSDGRAVSDEEAALAFTQCMRDEGLNLPDPTVDSDGNVRLGLGRAAAAVADLDPAEVQAAFEQCAEHLGGITFGFTGEDRAELQDRLLEFAVCMRENGYDMPDPDFSNFGRGSGPGDGPFGLLDLADPQLQEALEGCEDVLGGLRRPRNS